MLIGDFVALGIVFVSLWFFYKHFGTKIMDKIEGKMDKKDCMTLMSSCQNMQNEKRKSASDLTGARFDAVCEKLDLIIERQAQIIVRLDGHINGHKEK